MKPSELFKSEALGLVSCAEVRMFREVPKSATCLLPVKHQLARTPDESRQM